MGLSATARLITAVALVAASAPDALALDTILPPARIDGNNDVRLKPDLKIGRFQGGRFYADGEGSAVTVTPTGGATPTTLADFTAAAATRYYVSGSFPLDSRAYVDAGKTSGGPFADYNTGAANAEFLDLTGTIPTNNPGAMRDGRFIMVRDRDTYPYEAGGYRAITNGLRVVVTGKADNYAYAIQSKDFHAGWFQSMGRTSGTGRGFSGILAEATQLGTGAATNEFAATSPSYANEQAAYLAASVSHVHNQKYAANETTNLAVGVQATTAGYLSTAAFRAASAGEVGQPGAAMYGLMMQELTVANAAITMPQSLNGSVGTIIKYGTGHYSDFNRTNKVFGWYTDGSPVLAAGNSLFSVNVDGTLKQVSVGSADSCGTGYKCLRVAN